MTKEENKIAIQPVAWRWKYPNWIKWAYSGTETTIPPDALREPLVVVPACECSGDCGAAPEGPMHNCPHYT